MAQPKTKAEAVAADAVKRVETLAGVGKGTMESALKAGTKHYEQAVQLTNDQVQKASERKTMNGLMVSRRPTMLGVMKCPSAVAIATNSAGASAA